MKTVYFRLVRAIRWRHFLISIYVAQRQGTVMAVTGDRDPARFTRWVILKNRDLSFSRKPPAMCGFTGKEIQQSRPFSSYAAFSASTFTRSAIEVSRCRHGLLP